MSDKDTAPRWARALLKRAAGSKDAHEVLGDLEEAHEVRRSRHGRVLAKLLTGVEALDMARALLLERWRARGRIGASSGARILKTWVASVLVNSNSADSGPFTYAPITP